MVYRKEGPSGPSFWVNHIIGGLEVTYMEQAGPQENLEHSQNLLFVFCTNGFVYHFTVFYDH